MSHATVPERVHAALKSAPYDAIITASPEGSKYLSGHPLPYALYYPKRPTVVLWPADAEPVLICGADQMAGPAASSWIEDLRPYREGEQTTAEALASVLAGALDDRGLRGRRVGYEELLMPVALHRAITDAAPTVNLVAADHFLDRLRATKTSSELRRIREVAGAAEIGTLRAFADAEAGWTERQLAAQLARRINEAGAETVPMLLVGVGEGARMFGEPTDRVLEPGQLVRVDLNALLAGYYADLGRMAIVGEPTPEQEAVYAAHIAINRAVLAAMRPGTSCEEVFAIEQRTAADLGVEMLEQPSIGFGHAIGTHPNDAPKLMPGDTTALEAGMVFNIEPDVIGPDGERVHVEEMVLVTEDGGVLLTGEADWSVLPRIAVA